jgi:hypothetical protein
MAQLTEGRSKSAIRNFLPVAANYEGDLKRFINQKTPQNQ